MNSTSSTAQAKRNNKVILLGDSGVGKTALISRFTHNKFQQLESPTIGIDFVGKNVNVQGFTYRLQLWDTAGQQRYRSLIPSYLKDAVSAIFVFDITKPESLDNLQEWIQLYKQSRGDKSFLLICGNKSDLKEKQNYSEQKLKSISEKHSMKVYFTSALNGEGVTGMFDKIIQYIHSKQEKKKKKFDDSEDIAPYSSQNLHNEEMKSDRSRRGNRTNRSSRSQKVQNKQESKPEDTRIVIQNDKVTKLEENNSTEIQGSNRCC